MEDRFFSLVQEVSPMMAENLGYIVRRFDEVIASKRRSSLIKTFEDLVMLLIKRNVIDPSNKSTWSTLNEVCTDFGKVFYDPSKQLSSHSEMRVPSTSYLKANGLGDSSLQQLDPLVVELLSSHIAEYSWRNFARALKVRECDISKIESNHEKDPSDCVREVLKIYLHQFPWASSSNNIREDILAALQSLRRNDLIHKFKKLTASN